MERPQVVGRSEQQPPEPDHREGETHVTQAVHPRVGLHRSRRQHVAPAHQQRRKRHEAERDERRAPRASARPNGHGAQGHQRRQEEPHRDLAHERRRGGEGRERGQPTAPRMLHVGEQAFQSEDHEQPRGVVRQDGERLPEEERRHGQHRRQSKGYPGAGAQPVAEDHVRRQAGKPRHERHDEPDGDQRGPERTRETGQQPVDERSRPGLVAVEHRPGPRASDRDDDPVVHRFVKPLVHPELVPEAGGRGHDHRERCGQKDGVDGAGVAGGQLELLETGQDVHYIALCVVFCRGGIDAAGHEPLHLTLFDRR